MQTVEKVYQIKANMNQVFEALTDIDLIEQWSGSSAQMDLDKGGQFSLWEGSIHGVNVSVKPNHIIQQWKEDSWQHFSRCEFLLEQVGENTTLKLLHADIPDASAESVDSGWDEYYLGPLKEMLESH